MCQKRGMTLRRYMLDNVGKSVERLSMIAGGTGITPMYQVQRIHSTWQCRMLDCKISLLLLMWGGD